MTSAVAFVLKGYPRLSETFIAQEISGLERRGFDIRLISLRHPTDSTTHPLNQDIRAPVSYLPEYLYREPLRTWRAWRSVRRRPAYQRTRDAWLRDLRRDPSPNRIRRFGQALVLAHELDPEIGWLHAHFLHTPASVVRYAAMLTGLPWSCSAHAVDIWTTPEWEKREKLADCRWLVTCTRANLQHLRELSYDPHKVDLVYHGLDFDRFEFADVGRSKADGGNPNQPVIVLSVGRAVEKKGFDVLIDALARLPRDLHWRLVHIGGGAKTKELKRRARRAGLGDRVEWLGAQAHPEVLRRYRQADLFALACRVGRNGDRDGLPNVLMEAQSQGVACLSTQLPSISELIEDGKTGLLVAPENSAALAEGLDRLIRDPSLRARLAEAGLRRLRDTFSFESGVDRLAAKLVAGAEAARCA